MEVTTVGASVGTRSGATVMPVSASNRWTLVSGSTMLTMSPGRTRYSEATIATMSLSAALRWSSSSLPRYSTTSARARNDPTSLVGSPMSRCSGRKPATSERPGTTAASWYCFGSGIDQSPGPTSRELPLEVSSLTSTKFIDGLPMKPATKRLMGVS